MASVWTYVSLLVRPRSEVSRLGLLTMPDVTVLLRPCGLPNATTNWPVRTLSLSPNFKEKVCQPTWVRNRVYLKQLTLSSFNRAKSVCVSIMMRRAGNGRPSLSLKVCRLLCLLTTCALVRMWPSPETKKPDPEVALAIGGGGSGEFAEQQCLERFEFERSPERPDQRRRQWNWNALWLNCYSWLLAATAAARFWLAAFFHRLWRWAVRPLAGGSRKGWICYSARRWSCWTWIWFLIERNV